MPCGATDGTYAVIELTGTYVWNGEDGELKFCQRPTDNHSINWWFVTPVTTGKDAGENGGSQITSN